jgi:hypothetical protein
MDNKILADLTNRVEALEKAVFISKVRQKSSGKQLTLAELARRAPLKKANGQQKIATIVGYFEKVVDQGPSKPELIKQGWKDGKFAGKYNPSFLNRAVGDLVRSLGDGTYDLTQAGEDFFFNILG